MQYNKEKWTNAIKKSIEDLKTSKVTSGRVCAVATVRYIRDGIIDDIIGTKPVDQCSEEDQAIVATIKESLNELIKQVSKSTEDGFASNASAAAKAAGYKSETLPEADGISE